MKLAERRAPMGRQGFTLVEVLAAMVILAVGLLALEALGIGAARAVVRADRQSEYTALATDRLERTLTQIDQSQNPASTSTVENGSRIDVLVGSAPAGGRTAWTVTVTVTPPANPTLTLQPVTVVGRAFR